MGWAKGEPAGQVARLLFWIQSDFSSMFDSALIYWWPASRFALIEVERDLSPLASAWPKEPAMDGEEMALDRILVDCWAVRSIMNQRAKRPRL